MKTDFDSLDQFDNTNKRRTDASDKHVPIISLKLDRGSIGCGDDGPCDYSVTPSPIGLWIFYFFGFGIGIGIGSKGTGFGTRA